MTFRIVGVSDSFARENEQKVYHGGQRTVSRVFDGNRSGKYGCRTRHCRRYVLARSLPSVAFPALSLAQPSPFQGEKGEREREGLSLSLSLAFDRSSSRALLPSFAARRFSRDDNGASSRNNRAYRSPRDPYRVNLFSCTGWTERRERGEEGLNERASVLRYLIALCSKWGSSQRPCRHRGCRHVRFFNLKRKRNGRQRELTITKWILGRILSEGYDLKTRPIVSMTKNNEKLFRNEKAEK